MRKLWAIIPVVLGLCVAGCKGDSSTDGVPKVSGKVEVKDMPEGTSAPGDKRPADTGAKTESGSRG